MLQDQKQLYEVRVQSQEQEIEQHQYRYKELEAKMLKDIHNQEQRFGQLQQKINHNKNEERDKALQQINDLQE